jgi:hypothetical protein
VTDELTTALALAHAGDRDEGRRRLLALWDRLGEDEPVARLSVAHALADLQAGPRAELEWDLRALALAEGLDAAELAAAGTDATVATLLPSLHLNAGDAARRTGDLDAAARHLARGRAALAALGHDPYGGMLTDGLARLADRIDAAR